MHAIDAIRAGNIEPAVFQAAYAGWSDGYALQPHGLRAVYMQGLRAVRPMLDVGSGLSTIMMGLAAEKAGVPVHALEADQDCWNKTTDHLKRFGLKSVTVHKVDLDRDWYAIPDDLPMEFGLVLVDGPQHSMAARALAYDRLASRLQKAIVMADDLHHNVTLIPFNKFVLDTRRVTHRAGGFAVATVWGQQ